MKKIKTIKIGGAKVNVKDMTPSLRSKIEEQLGETIEDGENNNSEGHIGNKDNDKKGQVKTEKEYISLFRKMFGFRGRKIKI